MNRDQLDQSMARVRAVSEELEIFADFAPYSILIRCADTGAEYRVAREAGDAGTGGDQCMIVMPSELLVAALRGEVRLQQLYRNGQITVSGDACQALIFSLAVAASRDSARFLGRESLV